MLIQLMKPLATLAMQDVVSDCNAKQTFQNLLKNIKLFWAISCYSRLVFGVSNTFRCLGLTSLFQKVTTCVYTCHSCQKSFRQLILLGRITWYSQITCFVFSRQKRNYFQSISRLPREQLLMLSQYSLSVDCLLRFIVLYSVGFRFNGLFVMDRLAE